VVISQLVTKGRNTQVATGVEGMCALSTLPEADLVVVAVAGAIGIAPTHAALHAGKNIALAAKRCWWRRVSRRWRW
jgi:1-deoxy-D-xylulose-5-phosphate reductoisomerase